MKRVLCILSGMNAGGAETFLMKMMREIDKKEYIMDFCVNAKENFYEDEIKSLGGKIYINISKSENFCKSFIGIRDIVKTNQYEYVMRVNEHSLSVIDLLAAKLGGAKKLIMRSSNAASGSKKSMILHKMFKFLPICVPDVKIAPSDLAAAYTFGKKAAKNGEVIYLHNGLDVEKYRFDLEVREDYRSKLDLENKLVIGHIGRFNEQKNHKFLIKVFNELLNKRSDAVLLLVGDGYMKEEIQEYVKELGIEESVKFLGIRKDIPNLLFSMDAFLFPSFYEGMPNTVIEAQTTGLPCLISASITKEAKVTSNVEYETLEADEVKWANHLLGIITQNNEERITSAQNMIDAGYDIKDCVKIFEKSIFNVI